jgi:phosphate transport system substrate-binding protein
LNQSAYFPALVYKFAWLFLCFSAVSGVATILAAAQLPQQVSSIRRVALDWPENAKASAVVRDRLTQKLKSFDKIQIVPAVAQADAVLRGSVTIWKAGYISTSFRSKAAEEPLYQGYASAELNDKNGNTLWSYLATPRRPGWKKITDDLGDQLAAALVDAIAQKDTADTPATPEPGKVATRSSASISLTGAGGTFPAPIYQKWFEAFERTRPNIRVSYAAVGSEEGVRRIRQGDVNFGASDMPLSDEQLRNAQGRLVQFATVLGAVVPIYNVKGAPDGLNFTPEVLAGIFLGKIHSWNAPEIRAINKHVKLPDQEIVVVHRSDGSGTTYAWTDYLSKVSEPWKSAVGSGMTVSWPVGVGAERNEGVAETVGKTPNSIGYVEFIYALQHELSFGAVRNATGEYVKADLDSVTAAAKAVAAQKGGLLPTSITNARGKHTYPIATFTWVLIPSRSTDSNKQQALRDLLTWMLTSGQKQCQSLGYAPLPEDLAAQQLHALAAAK